MSILQNLVTASQLDESVLRQQARPRQAQWQSWLAPISDTQPTGSDPGYDDDFQRIREEVNKTSGVDTELICQLAEKLLTQTYKGLHVITFYVWARLQREGESGLAESVTLLVAMLERFGAMLHSQREHSYKLALEWLGSCRMSDSLSLYPEVDMTTMQVIIGALLLAEASFTGLAEASRPDLSRLYRILENRLVQDGGARNLVPRTSREERDLLPQHVDTAPVMHTVTSGRDLLDQAKVLAKYLRECPGGWLTGRHLMKSVRWNTLTELPLLDASNRTRLLLPKPEGKAHLRRLYLQKSWSEPLEYTNALLAQGVDHLWLDVQWYAWQALLKLDTDSVRADIPCRDMKGLLARLSGLEALAFNDSTPFADEVTLNWPNERVLDEIAGWQDEPIMAATSANEVLSLGPEVLTRADDEGIESVLNWLQAQPGYTTSRNRRLMCLSMARVSEQYGENEMALHLLAELDSRAREMAPEQWEPELISEVKARRLRLLRGKAGHSEAEKNRLLPEMESLLTGLITLGPARAAVLRA